MSENADPLWVFQIPADPFGMEGTVQAPDEETAYQRVFDLCKRLSITTKGCRKCSGLVKAHLTIDRQMLEDITVLTREDEVEREASDDDNL